MALLAADANGRERVIVDFQLAITADDLERAPGAGGEIEVLRGTTPGVGGILTGEHVTGGELPRFVLQFGLRPGGTERTLTVERTYSPIAPKEPLRKSNCGETRQLLAIATVAAMA